MATTVSIVPTLGIQCSPNCSVSSKSARDFLDSSGLRYAHPIRPEKGERATRGHSRRLGQLTGIYFRTAKKTRPLKAVEFPSYFSGTSECSAVVIFRFGV
jgi:hypothetical protein